MTLTAPEAAARVAADTLARPVWRSYGGGGLLAGGTVLLFATAIEWAYYANAASDPVLLLTYGVSFVAALTVLAGSTLVLALGATGRDGIVGASVIGRVAVASYGGLFLAAQVALLLSQYALSGRAADAAGSVSLVLTILQTVAAIVAAIAILRARIATGVARWSMAVSVVIGIAAGSLANAAPSLEAVMLGFCASATSILLVGISYLLRPPAGPRDGAHDARETQA